MENMGDIEKRRQEHVRKLKKERSRGLKTKMNRRNSITQRELETQLERYMEYMSTHKM